MTSVERKSDMAIFDAELPPSDLNAVLGGKYPSVKHHYVSFYNG